MSKKVIGIVLVTTMLLLSSGCIVKRMDAYPFLESADQIDTIEIISAESSLEYSVIKVLSDAEKEIAINYLQKMEFQRYAADPGSLYGNAIKITYTNGIYEIFSIWAAEYVENGQIYFRWLQCNPEDFEELISLFP